MPARRVSANNHLQEAMALLINNQAALLAQVARNEKERVILERRFNQEYLKIEKKRLKLEEQHRKFEELQRKSDEQHRKFEELQRKSDEQHRKFEARLLNFEDFKRESEGRFQRIETELRELPKKILQTFLDQMPRIKKEIGFKS